MELKAPRSRLCGRLWTPFGDLRIRRLGIRVLPGVLANLLCHNRFGVKLINGPSDVWEPSCGPASLTLVRWWRPVGFVHGSAVVPNGATGVAHSPGSACEVLSRYRERCSIQRNSLAASLNIRALPDRLGLDGRDLVQSTINQTAAD